jgi:hypothetical protein
MNIRPVRLGHFVLGLALLLALSSVPESGRAAPLEPAKPNTVVSPFQHESVEIDLDPGWWEARRLQRGNECLLQFLPPGDTAQDVHKMINFVSYFGLQKRMSPREFMLENKKSFQNLKHGGEAEWKAVKDDDPDDVAFEYRLHGRPGIPDQYELQRVIKGKDALHSIIFHLRKPEASAEERSNMLKVIERMKLLAPEKSKTTS